MYVSITGNKGNQDVYINIIGGLKLDETACDLPVCIAKTPFSFSHDPKLLGAPKGFTLPVQRLILNAGAGFVVVTTGAIMRMPGLPKVPAAMSIDVKDGKITGLA